MMKRKEYREILKKLGIAVDRADEIIGLSWRQCRRFADGDSPVPKPVARLLRVMLKHNIRPDEVARMN